MNGFVCGSFAIFILPNRRGTDLDRRKPDTNTCEGSQHKADQDQHLEIAMHEDSRAFAATSHREPLEIAQQNATPNGELGEKHGSARNEVRVVLRVIIR